MSWTRREFMATTGAALTAAALDSPAAAARARPVAPAPVDAPAFLVGDPWLACTEGGGLGGRSFEEARERALRFRMPAALRDAHVLGLKDA